MLELVAPSRFRAVVVVAVHNQASTVPVVIDAVRKCGWRCIVVDDASDSGCAAKLDALAEQHGAGLVLLRLAEPAGHGAAVIAGLREASRQGYSHAAQIDADGQYDAGDIGRFVARARRHPAAVICGYPLYDRAVPRWQQLGRALNRACVWVDTLSMSLRDPACRLRVYPLASVLALLDDEHLGEGAGFDTEVLVRLSWRGVEMLSQHTRVKAAKGAASTALRWGHRQEPDGAHEEAYHDARAQVRAHAGLHLRLLAAMLRRRLLPPAAQGAPAGRRPRAQR